MILAYHAKVLPKAARICYTSQHVMKLERFEVGAYAVSDRLIVKSRVKSRVFLAAANVHGVPNLVANLVPLVLKLVLLPRYRYTAVPSTKLK